MDHCRSADIVERYNNTIDVRPAPSPVFSDISVYNNNNSNIILYCVSKRKNANADDEYLYHTRTV